MTAAPTTLELADNRPTRLALPPAHGSASSVVLWLGDCRDVLPVTADAVITGPPYGLGDRMQGGTWGAAAKYANLREWDKAPTDEMLATLMELASVCVIWGGNNFRMPASRCWLVWDKQNAVPTMSDVEMAWTNLDKPAKRKSLPVGVHNYGHPTEKPLALMAWTLEQAGVPKGATVLDPYMGSGTTGVAAIRRGCNFVGIERDPTHYQTAVERIRNELNQGVLL
jgi:DNA modification methylase